MKNQYWGAVDLCMFLGQQGQGFACVTFAGSGISTMPCWQVKLFTCPGYEQVCKSRWYWSYTNGTEQAYYILQMTSDKREQQQDWGSTVHVMV